MFCCNNLLYPSTKKINDMKTTYTYHPEHCIYPGTYVPFMPEKEVKEEIKRTRKKDIIHPPVKVTEHEEFFAVELDIPGVKREEFLIEARENILSVYVVHNNAKLFSTEEILLQKNEHTCFDRHIILDENIDTEFIIAEYLAGILKLHVPKTDKPVKVPKVKIIVY